MNMMRDAYDKGIILVSKHPYGNSEVLKTFGAADQNRNAQLIADKAGKLYDQFVLYIDAMEDIGKHLDHSKDAWDTAHKRLSTGSNLVGH